MTQYCPIVAKAIQEAGGQTAVSKELGVVQPAVYKWTRRGLPRTEWTKETDYATKICELANENPDRSREWNRVDLLTRELAPMAATA